jgi:DUF4097 and DUF4098 domain-containing protein YvlB
MILPVLAVILAAFTNGGARPTPAVSEEPSTPVFNGPVAQGAWFRIRTPKGEVEVREASGRNVVVTATKRSDWRGSDEVKFEVRRDGANVTVCAIWPRTTRCDAKGYDFDYDNGNHNDRDIGKVDFLVELPKGIKLVAATGNGDIEVRNTGSEVLASSGNGQVTVVGAGGRVTATSGNGDLEVKEARGDVEARTGNGDIEVTTSVGPVTARTGNGRIDVDMSSLRGDDDMDFSTGNGSIEVSFPPNLSALVETNVQSRNVETDFPIEMASHWNSSHISGKIGAGGRRIRFSTGNGHVRIKKAG